MKLEMKIQSTSTMPKLTICLLCLCGTKEQINPMDQIHNSMESCREGQRTTFIQVWGRITPQTSPSSHCLQSPNGILVSIYSLKPIQEQLQMLPFPNSFPISPARSQDQALLWHFPTDTIYQNYIKLSLNTRTQLPLNNPKITELMDRIPLL